MNLLIIGNGGREHALASVLRRSVLANKIFVCPGNGGTAKDFINVEITLVPPFDQVINFCHKENINLVVVGSENYLTEGISDRLQGIVPVFGPSKDVARLESSKIFAKKIMNQAKVKTASYMVFNDYNSAKNHLTNREINYVLKADGLCAGKGVVVPETLEDSMKALKEYFLEKKYGPSGNKVIVEDKLFGLEVSIIGFCDGNTVRLMAPSQDHKRAFDNDLGPNTGGMGVYTPVNFIGEKQLEEIKENIFLPILKTMSELGTPYRGILYAGLIVDQGEINVIEFNVRFGDPECQCVLPLLKSDLLEIMLACIDGKLDEVDFKFTPAAACTVVLSSKGYPNDYEIGKKISGLNLPTDNNNYIFHAGTKLINDITITNGGRVLSVSTIGKDNESLSTVIKRCYSTVEKIDFENCFYRKDIGLKGI